LAKFSLGKSEEESKNSTEENIEDKVNKKSPEMCDLILNRFLRVILS